MIQNDSRTYIFVPITFGILFMISSLNGVHAQPVNENTENIKEMNTSQMEKT